LEGGQRHDRSGCPDGGKHHAIADEPPPANTEHIKRRFLDVPYAGVSAAQKLDVYLPDERPAPCR